MAPTAPSPAGHILLVEDDRKISRILRRTLAENGFTTSAMASAAEMAPLLERGNVHLVVLDVMLLGKDGFSVCRRLCAASAIPILMLAALGRRRPPLRAILANPARPSIVRWEVV